MNSAVAADGRQVLSADAYDAAVRTGESLSPERAAELALSHENAEPLEPAAADNAAPR